VDSARRIVASMGRERREDGGEEWKRSPVGRGIIMACLRFAVNPFIETNESCS
jgi:hypothetical protein